MMLLDLSRQTKFCLRTVLSLESCELVRPLCFSSETSRSWGAYSKNEPAKVKETWDALLAMFAKGETDTHVAHVSDWFPS